MRIPLSEIIASQLLFWSISLSCGIIAWKFYRSRDGIIRILQIQIFGALCFSYGLAGFYWALWDAYLIGDYPAIFIRLICNAPIAWAIVRYLRYFSRG